RSVPDFIFPLGAGLHHLAGRDLFGDPQGLYSGDQRHFDDRDRDLHGDDAVVRPALSVRWGTMSAVAVDNLTKHYGRIAALDGVSALFGEGEFFGLLGPSGSGKTTLLRAIAGFVEPDSGRIAINGTDMAKVPVHRRNIGMVFQNYALFPHLSVFEN